MGKYRMKDSGVVIFFKRLWLLSDMKKSNLVLLLAVPLASVAFFSNLLFQYGLSQDIYSVALSLLWLSLIMKAFEKVGRVSR